MEEVEAPSAAERAKAIHTAEFGDPELVVRAPGRVNLIGEHTDYNDGFCLPMALPFDTVIAVSSCADEGVVTVSSEGFGSVRIRVEEPGHELDSWAEQIAGVLWYLQAEGIAAGGWIGSIASDIPAGAGLSSSAAIEVAAALVVLERNGLSWPPLDIAKLAQRVESEVVGVRTGIMDQYISAGATLGHASLLDCRDLSLVPVPLPEGVSIAVIDSGTRRALNDGAYDERRANCEAAAALLELPSLRDASMADVEQLADANCVEHARARHVVSENLRTVAAVEAMAAGDSAWLGSLMNESHLSLRDDFEVSAPALDQVVAAAQASPGCLGARMTGGGFAGCAVALVQNESLEAFRDSVLSLYSYVDSVSGASLEAAVWFCTPEPGAGVLLK